MNAGNSINGNRFTDSSLFKEFTPGEKDEMLKKSQKVPFKKGGIIFEQGEESNVMYFIDSGQVRLTRFDPDGKELVLAILDPGEFFGEMALLDGFGKSCRASAVTDLILSSISKQDFTTLLLEQPHLSLKVIAVLCRRLRATDQELEEIAFGRVKDRLRSFLLDSASVGKSVQLDLTHQELAAKIGACRETVTRALKELQEEGWRFEKKIIPDTSRNKS